MLLIQTWQPGKTSAIIMSLFENKQKRLLYCEYYEASFGVAYKRRFLYEAVLLFTNDLSNSYYTHAYCTSVFVCIRLRIQCDKFH